MRQPAENFGWIFRLISRLVSRLAKMALCGHNICAFIGFGMDAPGGSRDGHNTTPEPSILVSYSPASSPKAPQVRLRPQCANNYEEARAN